MTSPVQQIVGLGLTPRQTLSMLTLLASVDLVALDVAHSLLRGNFPRYQRDVPARYRHSLLRRIVRESLAIVLLDIVLATRTRELREIDEALAALRASTVPKVPPVRPVLEIDAVAPALDYLVNAVLLRIVERRTHAREGLAAAAWVDEFRKACLSTEPRLIPPAVTVETLDRTLRRLRTAAGLPSVRELGTRRSARQVGIARLRAWGFAVRGTTHSSF